MTELLMSLLVWIGGHSAYNAHIDLPNLVFTNLHNMCANYGINNKQRCEDMKLRGFFDKRLSIYLRPDFDPGDPHHQSQLLHELVHYVQFINMKSRNYCLGLLELEAYDLQDQWRVSHGLKPVLGDFNRLMLEASCSS